MALAAALLESKHEQRDRFVHDMSKPIQHSTSSAFHEEVVSTYKFTSARAVPSRRQSELVSGSGLVPIRERGQPPSRSQVPTFEGGLLGQIEFGSGPSVDLSYTKQLLEQEQITAARTYLEHAIKRYPQDERLRQLYRTIAPGRVVRRDKRYRDRAAEVTWIQAHRDQYRGKWVALCGDQVLGIGDDLQTVLRRVREHQLDEPPLIHHFVD